MPFGQHPETERAERAFRAGARRRGLTATVTSRRRDIAKQTELYRRWRAKDPRQRLPVAFPGTSTHNYGFAFDAVVPGASHADLRALAREAGLVWAGPKDPVHFQVVEQATWSRFLTEFGVRDRIRARFRL